MTTDEEKIFVRRYWKAHRQNSILHTLFSMGCGGLFLAGVLQFDKLWGLVVLASFGYPLMYIRLFSRWDAFSLLEKVRITSSRTTGSVFAVQSNFGISEISYSYSVKGKSYRGYDLVSVESVDAYEKSDSIEVFYSPTNPKISMIKGV